MSNSNMNLYRTWAPDDADWTAWAKPVLFASLPSSKNSVLDIPSIAAPLGPGTMIIVDLHGKRSVEESLAYASLGYRPVPLYNGVRGAGKMLVDVTELGKALRAGAKLLKTLPLSPGAPPVFMLDSMRMNGFKDPGLYDNRWCVFPQDMPSAEFLASKGINKVIVRLHRFMAVDLQRVLYAYQKGGIALFSLKDGDSTPTALSVQKTSFAEELSYRLRVTIGLKRNATGGFGGRIPEPHERGGSGRRFYGAG
jgi:hypothetical protein